MTYPFQRTFSSMLRKPPLMQVREKPFVVESYLRPFWTSHEEDDFESILASIPPLAPSDITMGMKEVFRALQSRSMNILAIVAVTDTGSSPGLIAKLASVCFQNGVPLVLGKGARDLGAKFGKRKVSCVAIHRSCAGKEGMAEFVSNLSLIASDTKIPLEEGGEIVERFKQEEVVTLPPAPMPPTPSISKPPPPKKQKTTPPKKAFFASFD